MNKQLIRTVSDIDKKKIKVQLESGEVFALYKGEAKKWKIKEGTYIEDAVYQEIRTLLYKRGKERALYLLKDSAKTTQEVRRKLQQGYYPADLTQQIIEFLDCYHYLDDSSYVQNYYEMHRNKKSRKEIMYVLKNKGIETQQIKDIIDNMTDGQYEESESRALCCQLEKKAKGKDLSDPKDRQKVIYYLMSKGFSYSDIASQLERML